MHAELPSTKNIATINMDSGVYTDPARIGPGIWFSMHVMAVSATTDERKRSFQIYVNALCDNFKCKKCQPHFRKFIDDHPFSAYASVRDDHGHDIGYFQWTWECHNQVNRFLKKPEPTLMDAYAYYSEAEAGVCFDCPSESPVEDTQKRIVPTILTLFREGAPITPQPFRMITPASSSRAL